MKPSGTNLLGTGAAPGRSYLEGLVALVIGVFLFAVGNSASAQENPRVRIELPETSHFIEGELLNFDDKVFYIKGALGVLRIERDSVVCIGSGCPDSDAVVEAPAATRDVVLHSLDGETQISGELVAVNGTHYVIRNRLGEFSILKASVECGGAACPKVEIYDPKFAVHVSDPAVHILIANMLRSYAEANNQDYEADLGDGAPKTIRLLSKGGQELTAEISFLVGEPRDALQVLTNNTPDIAVLDQQQFDTHLRNAQNLKANQLQQTLIAYGGQVIVGNPANPVRNLDASEVAGILDGTITSWRTLGGGNFPLSVHMVRHDATTGTDVGGWLSNFGRLNLNGVIIHETEADLIAAVDQERNAIGFAHRATAAAHHAKMMDLRKTCGLTTSPTNFDMQLGQYPLSQPVYAYGRRSGIHPVAESFAAWMQTPQAQQSVGRSGFVDTNLQRMRMQDMGIAVIHTAAQEPDFDGLEFSSMMRELRDADRLSISFRFLPGSATLDDVSVENVKELAEHLRNSTFEGQEVLLVGFADSIGPADRNTILSARRAETVQRVLEREFNPGTLARLNIQSLSFGEQMPLDCNETDTGRANNRRVEVWVRG